MAYEYYENVLALIAIFALGFYIQDKQKNNWIVGIVNLICVSWMCFAIDNEFFFQLMVFFINLINCVGHLFQIQKTRQRSERRE